MSIVGVVRAVALTVASHYRWYCGNRKTSCSYAVPPIPAHLGMTAPHVASATWTVSCLVPALYSNPKR